jgi:N-formylglutamate amidohydrolase
MFSGRLPPYANISSTRVAGGLGTVPRLVAENIEIYAHPLPVAEALRRIETIYRPYHACLRRLVARTHAMFGQAVLFDCHSMPASVRAASSTIRPDFIIGDRYGTSASQELSRAAALFLQELGYNVTRNKPYAGGFITEHYGRPAQGLHALQIEVNRGLYFDEELLEKKPGFGLLAADLSQFIEAMAGVVQNELIAGPLAAE